MRKKIKRPARPDRDRDVFKVLRAIKDMSTDDLAKRTHLAMRTIENARLGPENGGTRYPHHMTLKELARLGGKKWDLVDDDDSPRIEAGRSAYGEARAYSR